MKFNHKYLRTNFQLLCYNFLNFLKFYFFTTQRISNCKCIDLTFLGQYSSLLTNFSIKRFSRTIISKLKIIKDQFIICLSNILINFLMVYHHIIRKFILIFLFVFIIIILLIRLVIKLLIIRISSGSICPIISTLIHISFDIISSSIPIVLAII